MCSEPVTLGGGMTIVKLGRPDCASGVNRPASTQPSYLRLSTSAGEYCGASWLRSAGAVVGSPLTSGEFTDYRECSRKRKLASRLSRPPLLTRTSRGGCGGRRRAG